MADRVVVIDATNPEPRVLKRAARLIQQGEVVVCPTDTGYAFSANGLDGEAVSRVFELKGRDYSNPIHVAVNSVDEVEKYAWFSEAARKLARYFLPGALTLVLPRKEIIPSLLVAGRDTVGIRIPDNKVILNLALMTGLPLTTTSANISGYPAPYTTTEIIYQLGRDIRKVALVLDQGLLRSRGLSTIVDLTVEPPRLLRQGLIGWEEISRVLHEGG